MMFPNALSLCPRCFDIPLRPQNIVSFPKDALGFPSEWVGALRENLHIANLINDEFPRVAAITIGVRRDHEILSLVAYVHASDPQGIQEIGLIVLVIVVVARHIKKIICHVMLWVVILLNCTVLVTGSQAKGTRQIQRFDQDF